MLARALLLGLLALASISSQAWATGPAYYPPGGSGSGVVANTCSAGDFFTAVDGSGNFTCSTASGSGDVTAVGDCASGACFDGTSGNSIQFEGSTADAFETTLTATDPTADRTITMPNRTGQMALEKVVNLYDYAVCDGTNEATGIQAAITAACALGPGGTLYVPADTCVYGSTLTLCSGLAIVGSDSTERVAYPTAQPHELSYSGTGTAIDAQSLSGVRLSGLLLRATSASFAGPLVDADGTGYLYIERVMMTAATQAGAATCALLSLNNATDVSVDGSAFYRCGYAIKGRALSSDFSNVVRLNHNAFYEAEACSVQNIGDAWEFTNNKWQQQGATDNESDLICHGAGICSEGVTFTGNMSVDQPSGPTNGQFIFCGSGVSISGNYIGGNTTQDGVLFDEQCDGCSVQGNWFGFLDEAVKFSGTGSSASNGVIVLGNDYDTVTTKVGGTRPGGSIMQENTGGYIVNETGDIWLNVDTDANSGAGTMVIGSNLTSTNATHQFDFTEAYANFRRGNDLRFYDADDSNYVEATVGTVNITSNKTLTIPDATGTMCVSAAAPLTLNATTGDLTTTADPVSIKGVAVTDTSGVDFVEGTGITITSNTGVSPDTATLAATLGTAIDTSEITDGTIAFADVNSTQTLAGNPANGASSVWIGTTGLIWEGATSDNFETLLVAADTTASDKTITLPNETGTVCTTGSICAGTVQYQAGLSGGDVTTTSGGASATIATGAVTTGKILDATIAQVDIDDTQTLAGNPANGDSSVWFATTGLIWEGATSNSNEGLLVAADVGGDRTWTLPDASGTIAVSASTPLTLNATTGNLTIADAAADSSTKGAVTFPSTHFTCTSGTCSLLASPTFGAASGTSYTWTWDLSSGTDPSLIFSTGAVALGSSTGLYGSTSSSGDLNLFSTTHATKGQINLDDQVDLWPSVADLTTGNNNTAVRFNSSTFDISGRAVFSLLSASSTTTMTGTLSGNLFPYYLGLDFSPTTTVTGDALSASYQYAVRMGGTSTTTAATHLPIAGGFLHNRTYTTSQVNGWVLGNTYALDDQPIFTQTSASGTQQMSGHYSLYHHPSFNSNGSNPSGFTAANDFSILHGNVYTAAAGNTLTITARGGLKYDAYTTSGSGTVVVTDDTAVTCGALGVPGTQAACIKSAIQADAKRYFLKDTGGAQSSLAGKFTTYNNITTAGTGLPIITGESGVSATKTADFTALSYTPPATAGRYRVEQVITTTSGTNTGSFQCTVDYVDSQGTTHTADLMPMVNQTGLWATALPVVAGASKEWHCGPTYITINNSATAIVLKVDVTTGTVNYTVAASVEQLG